MLDDSAPRGEELPGEGDWNTEEGQTAVRGASSARTANRTEQAWPCELPTPSLGTFSPIRLTF